MNHKLFSTERGQALIIIALAAIGLFGIAGLAIDGSMIFSDRRNAQNAADTAVLAGALANLRGESDWDNTAKDRAGDNGYEGNLVDDQIWVYSCDTATTDVKRSSVPDGIDCGPYEGNSLYVQVVIRSYVKTTFARILGIHQLQNTVQAIAMAQEEYIGELYNGASVVGLAPDQCKTVWFSGGAETNISGGGIFSNSNKDCGVTIGGSTDLHMDGSVEMVAGSYTKNGNPPLGDIDGGLHGGADQYDYPPPAAMLPTYTCNWTYASFPPSGVTTLSSGTYCVTGTFKMNSGDTLTGTGVTIVMESGNITWNGHATINLTAPTTGDLAGMLIYAPMSNTSTMRFNGNGSSNLTGTVFMPGAPIVYNGTGNLTPSHVQIIGYTVELTGTSDSNIIYQDSDNWDSNAPAETGLMQ